MGLASLAEMSGLATRQIIPPFWASEASPFVSNKYYTTTIYHYNIPLQYTTTIYHYNMPLHYPTTLSYYNIPPYLFTTTQGFHHNH